MSSGERPIGAAKGKQSDTEALCQPPPPPDHSGAELGFNSLNVLQPGQPCVADCCALQALRHAQTRAGPLRPLGSGYTTTSEVAVSSGQRGADTEAMDIEVYNEAILSFEPDTSRWQPPSNEWRLAFAVVDKMKAGLVRGMSGGDPMALSAALEGGPEGVPKWVSEVHRGQKYDFFKHDPGPCGMPEQVVLALFEPVMARFGPPKIPGCLENAAQTGAPGAQRAPDVAVSHVQSRAPHVLSSAQYMRSDGEPVGKQCPLALLLFSNVGGFVCCGGWSDEGAGVGTSAGTRRTGACRAKPPETKRCYGDQPVLMQPPSGQSP